MIKDNDKIDDIDEIGDIDGGYVCDDIANAESLTESEALANQKGAHYLSGCRRHTYTHELTHIHSYTQHTLQYVRPWPLNKVGAKA